MSGKPQFIINSDKDRIVNLSAESIEELSQSPYCNDDIKPIPRKERSWGLYTFSAFWVSLVICIPTYMLTSGFMEMGLSPVQAIWAVIIGQIIVLIPMLLNSIPGTKYGIPFPVYSRISMGVNGAKIADILRGLAGAGWFAITCWIGGGFINVLVVKIFPAFDFNGGIWICFFAFWGLNVFLGYRGVLHIGLLQRLGSPIMVALCAALLIWAIQNVSIVEVLSEPSSLAPGGESIRVFLLATFGATTYWATLALNIPDLTRYSKNQKSQLIGQGVSMPLTMAFLAFVSVVATYAGYKSFGELFWDPVVLLANFPPAIVVVAVIGIFIVTLTTNLGANVIAPVNNLISLSPRRITWKRGVLILAAISLIMQPWYLLSSHAAFVFGWMDILAIFMAPLAGIYIVDFFLIKKQRLILKDLYLKEGRYTYKKGFNTKAVVILFVTAAIMIIGKFVPALSFLNFFTYGTGFAIAAIAYYFAARNRDSASLTQDEFSEITARIDAPQSTEEA